MIDDSDPDLFFYFNRGESVLDQIKSSYVHKNRWRGRDKLARLFYSVSVHRVF